MITKESLNRLICFNRIVAFCLVAAGLLANQWLLSYLFPSIVREGGIILEGRIYIWIFELFCFVGGLLVYFRGDTPEGKKWLAFVFITVILVGIAMEGSLHIAYFFVHLNDPEENISRIASLTPYKDKEWAQTLFQDFKKVHDKGVNYQSYKVWDRGEYHSKYINIDSQGVRKTWNPEDYYGKTPKTVYIFGESTMFGAYVRDDYTIASYLSRLLNNDDSSFAVTNYGMSAYNFTHEIIQLILLLKEGHRPNYAIFYDGVNDVYGAYQNGKTGVHLGFNRIRKKFESKELTPMQHSLAGIKGFFKDHFMIHWIVKRIANLFRQKQRFQEIAAKYDERELKILSGEIVDCYIKSLQLLDRLAQVYDFKYICFWQPVTFTENKLTVEETNMLDARIHDEALGYLCKSTNESLKAKSFPHFFNISDTLNNRTKTMYTDYCHVSEEGNEKIASKILQIFEKEF